MARRIRWQILIAAFSSLLIVILLGRLMLSTSVARPESGGTLVEMVVGIPQHITPLDNDPLSDPAGRDLIALIFDGLTRIGSGGLPEPALAESWEVDPSGLVYTVHLRRGVVWHDGEAFDADDVIFTFQAIQQYEIADAHLASVWREVMVDRIDRYTVRFTLDTPYAPLLSAMRIPMLPAHHFANLAPSEWSTAPFLHHPIGTGPYILMERSETSAHLKANPSYFRGAPFIQQLTLRFFDAPQGIIPLLARQEAQAAGFSNTREIGHVPLPNAFRRICVPLDSYAILSFNLRTVPLDQVEFRQALAHALDKDTLLAHLDPSRGATPPASGGEQRAAHPPSRCNLIGCRVDTPILPGWWGYDPSVAWYAYDPNLAATMLDRLGCVRNAYGVRECAGTPVVLPLMTSKVPEWLAAAEEIARQWGMLGISVPIESLEPDDLRDRLQSHQFVLAIHGWSRLGPDPDIFELWHSSRGFGEMNYAGLQDEAIDQTLREGRITSDAGVRLARYADFQRQWVARVPAIVLYQPTYSFVAHHTLRGLGFEYAALERTDAEGDHVVMSNALLIGREDRYRHVNEWFIRSSLEIRGTIP